MTYYYPFSAIYDIENFSAVCVTVSTTLNDMLAMRFAYYNNKIIKNPDSYLLKEIDRLDQVKFHKYLNQKHIALTDVTDEDLTTYCIDKLHVKLKQQTILSGVSGTVGAVDVIDYVAAGKININTGIITAGVFAVGGLVTFAAVMSNACYLSSKIISVKDLPVIKEAITEKLTSLKNNELDFRANLFQANDSTASANILLIGISMMGKVSKIIGSFISPLIISPITTLTISITSAISGITNLHSYMKMGFIHMNSLSEAMAYTISPLKGSKNTSKFVKYVDIHKDNILASFNLNQDIKNISTKELILLLQAKDPAKFIKLREEMTAFYTANDLKKFCKNNQLPYENPTDLISKYILDSTNKKVYYIYIKIACIEILKSVAGVAVIASLFSGPLTLIIVPCIALPLGCGLWHYHVNMYVKPGRKLGEKLGQDLLDPSITFTDENLKQQAKLCRELSKQVVKLIEMDIGNNYPITKGQAQADAEEQAAPPSVNLSGRASGREIKYLKLLNEHFAYTAGEEFLEARRDVEIGGAPAQIITATLEDYMTPKKSSIKNWFVRQKIKPMVSTVEAPAINLQTANLQTANLQTANLQTANLQTVIEMPEPLRNDGVLAVTVNTDAKAPSDRAKAYFWSNKISAEQVASKSQKNRTDMNNMRDDIA